MDKFINLTIEGYSQERTPSPQSVTDSPAQLMGKAWLSALKKPKTSLNHIAHSLGLDIRALKNRLEYLQDPSGEPPRKTWFSFLEGLSTDDRNELVAAAKETLTRGSRKNT